MDIYAQNILDRYKNPLHQGRIEDADIKHKEANHSCGDKISITLKIKNGKVAGYAFEGEGCAISMAAADMMGDIIIGMMPNEILKLKTEDVYKILGIEISPRRSKCALLAFSALQKAVKEYL